MFCNRCGKQDLEKWNAITETLPLTEHRKKPIKLTRVFCVECGQGLLAFIMGHPNFVGTVQKI